ncbi:hypothetical protein WJX73_002032 [Symbiochloris irregularis]|uniref:Uncharacterized protein n=1 Tax=Symbiochloris irregularis TaxID=706552 RepID=A0AAW1P2G4_9CHLO
MNFRGQAGNQHHTCPKKRAKTGQHWKACLALVVVVLSPQLQFAVASWSGETHQTVRTRHMHDSAHLHLEVKQLAVQQEAQKVAVVNTIGFHNEVYAALLYSFQQAGGDAEAFVELPATNNIQEVLHWYKKPFQSHKDFLPQACSYDVVVIATFPEHHTNFLRELRDKSCEGQQLVLMVHNPDTVLTPEPGGALSPVSLMHPNDTHVLTLVPRMVVDTRANLVSMGMHVPVSSFVPVFPVSLECSPEELAAQKDTNKDPYLCDQAERHGFVLQGLFQSHRRNYHSVFEGLAANQELMNSSGFHLTLIGQGQLDLPEALQGKVSIHTRLPYKAYYRYIRQAIAVLPAFASEVYYNKKSSSSVAAAVVCSTPVFANQRLLTAYPYLSKSSVYFMEDREDDVAAMLRLLAMPQAEVQAHIGALQKAEEELFHDNERTAAGMEGSCF